jgi:homoserine kinase type II
MRALARFHEAVADFAIEPDGELKLGALAPERHLARLRALTAGRICDLGRAVVDTHWPGLAPLARRFIAALPSAVSRAVLQLEPLAGVRLPAQVCVRDVWHDHVLFTGDEVTGLVDFGAIDIDTPATDLARLLGSLVSVSHGSLKGEGGDLLDMDATWREGLAAYQSVRPLEIEEIRAANALRVSGPILAGCNWIEWVYADGRTFEDPERIVRRFKRIVGEVRGRD